MSAGTVIVPAGKLKSLLMDCVNYAHCSDFVACVLSVNIRYHIVIISTLLNVCCELISLLETIRSLMDVYLQSVSLLINKRFFKKYTYYLLLSFLYFVSQVFYKLQFNLNTATFISKNIAKTMQHAHISLIRVKKCMTFYI